ncbi:hypothetical protein D6850_00620 [Roseovarius spongiae]|uniref:Uncharacterized protein n=1 Tax=Roseovarius spongiae TaxID=2320272 RepID=A0A3A8AV38_9RHOB|nr:hypothetical protein D6850_00620 [Roseovarius spongiae]
MQNTWILDVLADLKTFAQNNNLGALAEYLDDTSLVAAAELASLGEGSSGHDRRSAGALGCHFGTPRGGH